VYFLQSELGAKRLGLLHEFLPKATVIGMLVNPNFAEAEFHAKEAQEAARSLGVQLHVVRASTVDEFDTAFSILVQHKAGGLFHANDAFFLGERRPLIALAARHALPTIYPWREFVVAGGLMSYSPSLVQAYRQAGEYTGKILKGAKPADLPIQPNKFEFVISLKTAKALGLTFPPGLLAIADEVIELVARPIRHAPCCIARVSNWHFPAANCDTPGGCAAAQGARSGPGHEQRSAVLHPALSLVPVDPQGHDDYPARDPCALASRWASSLLAVEIPLRGRSAANPREIAGVDLAKGEGADGVCRAS
jgi:hypothetical protein